jgi:hypothetical protein
MQEEQGMTSTWGMDPFLKEDVPLLRPGAPWAKSPGVHQKVRPMTRGPGPTRRGSRPEERRRQTTTQGPATASGLCAPSLSKQPTVGKANRCTRGMQPSRG